MVVMGVGSGSQTPLLCCVLSLSIVRSAASPPRNQFLGIAPQDEKYYKSSEVIKCKDGSKKFSRAQLNDDFCDCPDGTDEPAASSGPAAREHLGFDVVNKGCCGTGNIEVSILCTRFSPGTCSDPSKYIFWDSYHPTEKAYETLVPMAFDKEIHKLF